MKCEPIQFFNKFLDVLFMEIRRSVNTFFDLNDQGEIVLVTFGDVADE